MGKKDARVDAYIAKAADFAKPVLMQLRQMIHTACPDVEETIKWSSPHFMYRGMLCHMAAFKQHCAFGFWHRGMKQAFADDEKAMQAMGQFGRIAGTTDLPSKKDFTRLVKQAMQLNESGVKSTAAVKTKNKAPLKVPPDLHAALRKNKRALATFDSLSASHKREYVDWFVEAKREETRQKRLQTALEWLAEGKTRNWKYQNC